jgi:hypothetical protein
MPGETEDKPSGWTVDTLHAHLDQQFRDLEKMLDERFRSQQEMVSTALKSAEKAVAKAETAADKRFDAMNEFRAQLGDQATTFASRTEVEVKIESIVERLEAEAKRTNERLAEINKRLDLTQGKATGLNAGLLYLFSGVAAIGTIVSLLVIFIH